MISGDVARKYVDAARQGILAPWQFGRAAVRARGPQPQLLLDAAKAALAAVLAWVLAAQVLHTELPWLAPYTAVFIIGTTVHSPCVPPPDKLRLLPLACCSRGLSRSFPVGSSAWHWR